MTEAEEVERETAITNGERSGKAKVKFDSAMPREEAVAYFDAIVTGLKQGKLHFKQGDKNVVVTPADHLSVEVKASRKGHREKVSFELSWEHDDGDSLEISSSD